MGLKRRKLKDWVARRLLSEGAAVFTLQHVGKHGRMKVCDLPNDGSPEDRAATIERTVSDESSEHVGAYPGRQQYVVQAVDSAGKQLAEFPFWLASSGRTDNGTALALPPPEFAASDAQIIDARPVGADMNHAATMVMIQQMRHNESLCRSIIDMAAGHAERDAEIIRGQQLHIDKLEGRRLEIMDLAEGMLCRSQERELVHQKYMKDEERKERLMGRVETVIIPALMKSKAVRGLLGAAAGEDVADKSAEEIYKLFMKLPDEIQDNMIKSLGQDDSHKLLDIFKKYGRADADADADAVADGETKH